MTQRPCKQGNVCGHDSDCCVTVVFAQSDWLRTWELDHNHDNRHRHECGSRCMHNNGYVDSVNKGNANGVNTGNSSANSTNSTNSGMYHCTTTVQMTTMIDAVGGSMVWSSFSSYFFPEPPTPLLPFPFLPLEGFQSFTDAKF